MSDSDDDLQRAAALAFEAASAVAEELRSQLQGKGKTAGGVQYVAQPAPGYDVAGLWHCFGTEFRSGYATHAIAMHWIIANRLGLRMQLTPHRTADVDIDRFPKDRYDLLFGWMKETVGIPRALICSYPPETAMVMYEAAPKLVPYVAFEGTKISAYGKRICDRGIFDKVWVVSDFVRDAYIAADIAPELVRTVRPMLCGGPWPMPPIEQLRVVRNRPVTDEDPYQFATVGTWQKRKGMHDLARAYWSTFKRDEPVVLTIRTSAFGTGGTIRELREKILGELKPIAAEFGDTSFPATSKLPRIRFEFGTSLTDADLIAWLGTIDCYVNPSYGEGMGIPQTWAKALGVPMVSTGFGAVGALLREVRTQDGGHTDRIIDWKLEHVPPEMCRLGLMYALDTEWGVYDPTEFGAAMRVAVGDGRVTDVCGARYVRGAFGEEQATNELRAALIELLGAEAIQELLEQPAVRDNV